MKLKLVPCKRGEKAMLIEEKIIEKRNAASQQSIQMRLRLATKKKNSAKDEKGSGSSGQWI